MTWSYSGDPRTSSKDAVRFWSGQTDRSNKTVSDEEILGVLERQANVKLAAADVLDALAAKFSIWTDERVGDVQRSGSKIADAFRKRATELRKEVNKRGGFFVGGLSKDGKDALLDDSDRVQPIFEIGQNDHPRGPDVREDDDDLTGCRR